MVACVDRFQQRVEVICGQRLDRGSHQHQRQVSVFESAAKRIREAEIVDRDDSLLDRPSELGDPFGQRRDDAFRLLERQAGEKHDPDARAGKGVALEVGRKGVVELLGLRHSSSSRACPVPAKQTIYLD